MVIAQLQMLVQYINLERPEKEILCRWGGRLLCRSRVGKSDVDLSNTCLSVMHLKRKCSQDEGGGTSL